MIRLTVASLVLLLGGPLLADKPRMTASFQAEGVLVSEGGQPVLFFQRTVKSKDNKWARAAYVHPVYDLSGNVITEDFPEDHRHHRGIFWAWHQVWVGEQKLGDAWVCKDFVWDVKSVAVTSPGSTLTLVAETDWKSPDYRDDRGRMIEVVRERAKIMVHAATRNHRVIDFDLSFRALVANVKIGGSEDAKGYGGFSPRIRLSPDQRFVTAEGEVEPTKLAIDAGPWVNITGADSGVVIIAHRSNPPPVGSDTPARWILRRSRSMQNAVYPGRTPVELSMQHPTRLQYRLVIHDGSLQPSEIEALLTTWH